MEMNTTVKRTRKVDALQNSNSFDVEIIRLSFVFFQSSLSFGEKIFLPRIVKRPRAVFRQLNSPPHPPPPLCPPPRGSNRSTALPPPLPTISRCSRGSHRRSLCSSLVKVTSVLRLLIVVVYSLHLSRNVYLERKNAAPKSNTMENVTNREYILRLSLFLS